MSRLRAALEKQPDPYEGVVKAIRVDYTAEIHHKADGIFSVLMERVEARVNAFLERVRESVTSFVTSEVARQMPVIPPPQITEVHPITQVIERPIERTIEKVVEERLIEADQLSSLTVQRDKEGRIKTIIRGGVRFVVRRNEDGLITGVDAK